MRSWMPARVSAWCVPVTLSVASVPGGDAPFCCACALVVRRETPLPVRLAFSLLWCCTAPSSALSLQVSSALQYKMVRISVLNDALNNIVNAERAGKRQVLIRPSSKVVIKFLETMMKHGRCCGLRVCCAGGRALLCGSSIDRALRESDCGGGGENVRLWDSLLSFRGSLAPNACSSLRSTGTAVVCSWMLLFVGDAWRVLIFCWWLRCVLHPRAQGSSLQCLISSSCSFPKLTPVFLLAFVSVRRGFLALRRLHW
jgi:hypothetical protein